MFFAKKKDLIGIDVGSTTIKLIKLKAVANGFKLESVGIQPLPDDAIVENSLMNSTAVVEGLYRLVNGLDIATTKDVASSVSGNAVIIRKIMLPAMSPEELDEEIQWEAEQYIPFDVNDVNIDAQIIDSDAEDPSKMNVLLVASKKDNVNDYLSVFNEAGLNLVVVDVDAFAIQNAFEMNYDLEPDMVYALINIGASMMNLNVVKNGSSLFTRDVQVGGGLYTEEIQKRMAISSEDAERMKLSTADGSSPELLSTMAKVNDTISMEIRRSLDFYNSNALEGRITKVLLSGGGCKSHQLVAAVGERLNLPVEIMNPFLRIDVDEKKFEQEERAQLGRNRLLHVAIGTFDLGERGELGNV
ncbi:MAG: type IV pilus assembly protein PilM [Geobacteraceae bacterium]|nr:type IV pilus assembly protein PilM [Geobacteraceae bacterium]